MEILIPVAPHVRQEMLHKEMAEASARVLSTPVDGQQHYGQMGTMGKILWELYMGEGRKRARAFLNPTFSHFMRNYFKVVAIKAKEMGYKPKDVMVGSDSGITRSGVILIRVVPKPGAVKVTI